MTDLNPNQERFCQEYMVDLNATQAAIRAGYAAGSASGQGSRLLANAKIQARIGDLRGEQQIRTEITADRVLQQYADIADYRFSDIANFDGIECTFKPMNEWPKSAHAAISSVKQTTDVRTVRGESGETEYKTIKIEFRVDDRLRALDAMGRHLGIFENPQSVEQVLAIAKALANNLSADSQ
jgi:phage terminase small subunit